MKRIRVNLKEHSYDILVGYKITHKLTKILLNLNIGKDAVIITNPTVKAKFGHIIEDTLSISNFTVKFLTVPDTEKSKSIKEAMRIIREIAVYDKRRRIFIIALGGGVVGDLAGFIASIYKRGTPYIQVPTTLLGQIDSSIGGKTAIDLDVAKNQIGVFYQPKLVFSDISFLKTLSKIQIISGLAEAVKYAIIKDKYLFCYLEKNYHKAIYKESDVLEYLTYRCSLIKAKIVSLDEKEKKGVRTILNFGHTIGHAIEAAGGYRKYNHGQAIALGMLAATDISREFNLLNEASSGRVRNLIFNIGLPSKIKGIYLSDIIKAYLHDKKFIGKMNRLILVKEIGSVTIMQDIPLRIIKKTLKKLGSP